MASKKKKEEKKTKKGTKVKSIAKPGISSRNLRSKPSQKKSTTTDPCEVIPPLESNSFKKENNPEVKKAKKKSKLP